MKIEITYDEQIDSVYVLLSSNEVFESEEIHPDIIVDYDEDDNIVGVEILRLRDKNLSEIQLPRLGLSASHKKTFQKISELVAA